MSYFQDVVTEYLRADRATFVNTECLIQLNPEHSSSRGTHWYCDAIAVNFREQKVFLGEVTYSETLSALFGRLQAWETHWPVVCQALVRDCHVPIGFEIQPWVFIPESRREVYDRRRSMLSKTGRGDGSMPSPRVTYLESVVPWRYRSWDRKLTALENEALSDAPSR